MILFGNIVCSIIDLRNIVKRYINNSEEISDLMVAFKKSTFKRDFSPSNDRVYYWKSWKGDSNQTLKEMYEEVCKAIDGNSNINFTKAISRFLDLTMPPKMLRVYTLEAKGFLPGPQGESNDNSIIRSARLSICRCDAASSTKAPNGNNLKISSVINGKPFTLAEGEWNAGTDNKYVYAVAINRGFDIRFTEILSYSDKSESYELTLGYVNTKGFGSELKRTDTYNPINNLIVDNVVSFAAYKDGGFLYVNQDGMLKTKGTLPNSVQTNLYQYGEKVLYVKSLKDIVLTLSEEGNLRVYSAKNNKVDTIKHVYWTELTSDDVGNVILKYRKFEECINKVFTYE